MNKILNIITLVGLVGISTSSFASQTNMQVSANLEKSCTISMEDIHFGEVDQSKQVSGEFLANIVVQKDIEVFCSNKAVYSITSEKITFKSKNGFNSDGYYLTNPNAPEGDEFVYNLIYNDSLFVDGSPTSVGQKTVAIQGIGNGNTQNHTIKAALYSTVHVWPGKMIAAGDYSKSHTFTLSF